MENKMESKKKTRVEFSGSYTRNVTNTEEAAVTLNLEDYDDYDEFIDALQSTIYDESETVDSQYEDTNDDLDYTFEDSSSEGISSLEDIEDFYNKAFPLYFNGVEGWPKQEQSPIQTSESTQVSNA
jgi:hypothetical protein